MEIEMEKTMMSMADFGVSHRSVELWLAFMSYTDNRP